MQVWSIQKFHLYLYVEHSDVEVDHKALQFIFRSNNKLSAKSFQWQLELQRYSFDIKYQKGKEHIADFTCNIRHSKDKKRKDIENPEQFYVNFVTQCVVPITMSLSQIKKASTNDCETQSLLKTTRTGKWYKENH